jgi:ribosomal protein S18 acetylase RimI-like enzyme
LIRLCFRLTGEQENRHTTAFSRLSDLTARIPRLGEMASMPRTGFVWEQNGEIVGNVSLIPFYQRHQRIYLIANVATHPAYRRRGIGRALTEHALNYARARKAEAVWLQVRDDNPTAIRIYTDLGFVERDRRTSWLSSQSHDVTLVQPSYHFRPRLASDWPRQKAWLRSIYPDEEAWYRRLDWNLFAPGLRYWLRRFLMDFEVRHWSVEKDGAVQAILSWVLVSNVLWLALPPQTDQPALTFLLQRVRQTLAHYRPLSLDLPAGLGDEALRLAGFEPQRTLLWMRAPGATS